MVRAGHALLSRRRRVNQASTACARIPTIRAAQPVHAASDHIRIVGHQLTCRYCPSTVEDFTYQREAMHAARASTERGIRDGSVSENRAKVLKNRPRTSVRTNLRMPLVNTTNGLLTRVCSVAKLSAWSDGRRGRQPVRPRRGAMCDTLPTSRARTVSSARLLTSRNGQSAPARTYSASPSISRSAGPLTMAIGQAWRWRWTRSVDTACS